MYIEIDTKYQEGLWLWSLETAWNTFGVRYDPASNWCQPFVLIPLNFHSFTPNAPHRKLFGIKIHFRFKACVDCGVQCTSVSALSWFFRHRDVLAQNRADPLCHSDPPFNQKTLPIVTLLIDYRCLNHKYLSDNPGKTQHSGSRHKHHQTLNTNHQQNTLKTQHNMNNAHQQHTSHTHTHFTHHTQKLQAFVIFVGTTQSRKPRLMPLELWLECLCDETEFGEDLVPRQTPDFGEGVWMW